MKQYYVGGYVRDELLGIKSKDIDYAVEDATYDELRETILHFGKIYQERPEFLSIRARVNGEDADFTLCRKDGFYSDARHPDEVHVGTIYDDLARRDFTVNAIAKTMDGEYIDPFDGQYDIARMTLRAVGDVEDRFSEDALRILRAMRFKITKGFTFDHVLDKALHEYDIIDGLLAIPTERIYEELRRCYEFSSINTLLFFREYRELEDLVFLHIGIELRPQI